MKKILHTFIQCKHLGTISKYMINCDYVMVITHKVCGPCSVMPCVKMENGEDTLVIFKFLCYCIDRSGAYSFLPSVCLSPETFTFAITFEW